MSKILRKEKHGQRSTWPGFFPSDPKMGFSSDLKTGLKTWPPFGESNGHDLKKLEEMGYLEVQGKFLCMAHGNCWKEHPS